MPISIGIPFYNAELFLADAIRSVFAQTHQDWELILIDDGSTDKSLEIARSINDPRVHVYSDGKNKKLAARLNEIVGLAKYDLIARMDADDLMSPTRLEKQIKILNENPNIDLVSTGVFSVTNDLKLIGYRGMDIDSVLLEDLLFKRVGITHAAVVGRKDWFKRNTYNTSLKNAQDYDLWLRSSFNKDLNIKIISNPLYYYREEGNVTVSKILRALKYERVMFSKYSGKYYLKLYVKSFLKTIVVIILSSINKIEFLLERRNKQVKSVELINFFDKGLLTIKTTKVSGLD